MESAKIHASIIKPRDETPFEGIKTLRKIAGVLTTPTKRDAIVNHEPGTVEKAVLVLLSSIMLDSGLDEGQALMEGIRNILYSTLDEIEHDPDPIAAIHALKIEMAPNSPSSPLSVHRTTVASMIPNLTRSEMDSLLADDYVACMNELDEMGCRSNAVTVAIDETHETSRSKHFNGAYSYVRVGQQSTWDRGFVYPCMFDVTHQLFMGCKHVDNRLDDAAKKSIRPWIQDVINMNGIIQAAGSNMALVEGDRGYFEAEAFACAYLKMLAPGIQAADYSRLVAPRKFTREKESFKWEYCLDDSKSQVFVEYIKLSPYTHPALREKCEATFEKTKDNCFKVPYACVAMVDEYTRKTHRTLPDARREAHRIQDKLAITSQALEDTERDYLSHRVENGIKSPTKPGNGRGQKRKKFDDDRDKHLYHECLRLHKALIRLEERKTRLLNALMFFAISLTPGEDPAAESKKFIELAKDYHSRWGIENGFRDVKGTFHIPVRSGKPTRRQFYLMVGMMLYNHWHVERKREFAAKLFASGRSGPPVDPARPWIRLKLEQEFTNPIDAVGLLVDLWVQGIKSVIKEKIKSRY